MQLSQYDFHLPDDLIAQSPLGQRDRSRMLMVEKHGSALEDKIFAELPEQLAPGDVLVINNTKVFPARLIGSKQSGARIEVFLVNDMGEDRWEALLRPMKRLKPGDKVIFTGELAATVLEKTPDGRGIIAFESDGNVADLIDRYGRTPLPPYIKRDHLSDDSTDRSRYQTVFAQTRGAIAAPTAGLHFTPEILDRLRERGVEIVEVTLHVGYGTFEPVRVDDLKDHRVLGERYEISGNTASKINAATADGRRVIAVGTTTTRALEYAASEDGTLQPGSGVADLTITPGYEFKLVGGLLTNFHLPMSSLLILVSTFGGHRTIMKAYEHAVKERYRFYSYGDCMLIV
jgi:S-adenosylmethionine:tRNA ribosyltransferase-isomerase